jgi:hypothetical protein
MKKFVKGFIQMGINLTYKQFERSKVKIKGSFLEAGTSLILATDLE